MLDEYADMRSSSSCDYHVIARIWRFGWAGFERVVLGFYAAYRRCMAAELGVRRDHIASTDRRLEVWGKIERCSCRHKHRIKFLQARPLRRQLRGNCRLLHSRVMLHGTVYLPSLSICIIIRFTSPTHYSSLPIKAPP